MRGAGGQGEGRSRARNGWGVQWPPGPAVSSIAPREQVVPYRSLTDHPHSQRAVVQELTLPDLEHRSAKVPPRALALSLAALTIPILATALVPEWLERDGTLLVWLPALLPAFVLTYYRGRRGASLA